MIKKIIKTLVPITILTILGPIFSLKPVSALVDTPWGPDRTTFTWASPATYATFNSITDNPQLGDERNFVRIREYKDGEAYKDEVTLERGKTYEVYIYYHNNADAHEIGKTAIGIADGAAVKSTFPATVRKGERAIANATIFASDTDPLEVWDGAYMVASEDLYLRYVPGTAIIHNGGALNGQSIGPDYLFGDGALLGYNKFSGLLPGCNEYAGYITYQIFADAPDFNVEKSVISGSNVVKAGDEITFKVRYENTGTMDQLRVVIRDILPDKLDYIPGSTILYNNNFVDGKSVNDDIVNESGMNIGNYAGGSGWAEIVYRAKVNNNAYCGDVITNSALVSTTDGNKTAESTITIDPDSCKQNPNPPEDHTGGDDDGGNGGGDKEELPAEIVNTGPLEIVLAVIIILGIGGGGFYLYRTHRTLKTVENEVSGKAPEKSEQNHKDDDSSQNPKNVIK